MINQAEIIITRLQKKGMRKTKALVELIQTLLEDNTPRTLAEIHSSKRLIEQCDKATVFRLLQKLVVHGEVRRLGLHERAAYFELLMSGQHRDYLVCTTCGSIEPIDAPCPVSKLENEIRLKTGYQNLHHELEFFGICPSCK
ncbi:MAG: Fur family transcriptional regulator [Luteolibacter sp.]